MKKKVRFYSSDDSLPEKEQKIKSKSNPLITFLVAFAVVLFLAVYLYNTSLHHVIDFFVKQTLQSASLHGVQVKEFDFKIDYTWKGPVFRDVEIEFLLTNLKGFKINKENHFHADLLRLSWKRLLSGNMFLQIKGIRGYTLNLNVGRGAEEARKGGFWRGVNFKYEAPSLLLVLNSEKNDQHFTIQDLSLGAGFFNSAKDVPGKISACPIRFQVDESQVAIHDLRSLKFVSVNLKPKMVIDLKGRKDVRMGEIALSPYLELSAPLLTMKVFEDDPQRISVVSSNMRWKASSKREDELSGSGGLRSIELAYDRRQRNAEFRWGGLESEIFFKKAGVVQQLGMSLSLERAEGVQTLLKKAPLMFNGQKGVISFLYPEKSGKKRKLAGVRLDKILINSRDVRIDEFLVESNQINIDFSGIVGRLIKPMSGVSFTKSSLQMNGVSLLLMNVREGKASARSGRIKGDFGDDLSFGVGEAQVNFTNIYDLVMDLSLKNVDVDANQLLGTNYLELIQKGKTKRSFGPVVFRLGELALSLRNLKSSDFTLDGKYLSASMIKREVVQGGASGKKKVKEKDAELNIGEFKIEYLSEIKSHRLGAKDIWASFKSDYGEEGLSSRNQLFDGAFSLVTPVSVASVKGIMRTVERFRREGRNLMREGFSYLNFDFTARIKFWIRSQIVKSRLETFREGKKIYLHMDMEGVRKVAQKLIEDREMTDRTLRVYSKYPLLVIRMLQMAKKSRLVSEQLNQKYPNVKEDVFRHVYWSYYLTKAFGPELAFEIADAYEYQSRSPQDSMRDRRNNQIGRVYARDGIQEGEVVLKILKEVGVAN